MLALLDTSHDLSYAEAELGCSVGQLLTPLTRFARQEYSRPFAIDNGAFASFDVLAFRSLLKREYKYHRECLFVAVPDVVGSARRTREVFDVWFPEINQWPLAYVAQDGQADIDIPWQLIKAVFIGGTTLWKMSAEVVAVIKAAKALGKWVHVGRVNTPGRFEYFEALGVDSIDGTGLSRYSWMRERIYQRDTCPSLFNTETAA